MTKLYRLKYIIRYSNYPRVTDEDVAQHSFFVTSLSIKLHLEYPKSNLEKILLMATIHDWPEADIDDISHKIKRDYPKIAKELKKAELDSIKQYDDIVVQAFVEYEEQKTLESKIVKLADTIQCVQYLENEKSLGNSSMIELLEDSLDREHRLWKEVESIYYNRTNQLPGLGVEDVN